MDVGTGASITFSSGFMAEILDIKWSGISRAAIDSTHMGTTTARTFDPATLFDPGELGVELALDPGTRPPIDSAAESVTVTLPNGAAGASGTSTWQAQGFLTEFEWGAPLEDKMTATAKLKFSGDITVTL